MKRNEFDESVRKTPQFIAVFELIKVPDWCVRFGITKGELFYTSPNDWTMHRLSNNHNFGIEPSYLRFKEYRRHDKQRSS